MKGGVNIKNNDEYLKEILHNNKNLYRLHYTPTAFLISKWN